ncbi:MAG: hypothetical protein R2939_03905 [Kofleriaceae bacterium]
MLGIPIGLAYANLSEWVIHKYVLHGLGKKPGSFWSFHWHEHHKAARRDDLEDPAYRKSLRESFRARDAQAKEVAALAASAVAISPLLPVAPWFVGTVWYSALNYYRVHKRAHLDPAWAREHLPWHVDHHLGPDQDANWCVTRPWFDDLLGTRKRYLGTERAAADEAKRARRAENAAARAAAAAT